MSDQKPIVINRTILDSEAGWLLAVGLLILLFWGEPDIADSISLAVHSWAESVGTCPGVEK